MSTFKPLLAHTILDTAMIQYPVLASCKLDGIRCVVIDGVAMSRNLKPIKNEWVQECIGNPAYNGMDGELIVGDIFAKDCYRATSSGVMSKDGKPDFKFHVFDWTDKPEMGFAERYIALKNLSSDYMVVVPHGVIMSETELLAYEQELLAAGAEGVMVRSMSGVYKQGRSTVKDGILGKLKRFVDDDFQIVSFEERMHNGNAATKDALGRTERSSHKENMVGRGDLGALVLRMENGTSFTCGSGFNDLQRREIWDNQDAYVGKWVKVKHFDYGVKDAVRFPTFLGFRDAIDL